MRAGGRDEGVFPSIGRIEYGRVLTQPTARLSLKRFHRYHLLFIIISMQKLILASVAMVAAVNGQEMSFDEIAAKVNSNPSAGWTAAVPTRFGSIEEGKRLCGTWLKTDSKYTDPKLPDGRNIQYPIKELPKEYNAVTAHSNCTVIAKVRDQSSCGSCWAFGSTESFEDRRCIATGEDKEFSTEDTASCCQGFACGFSMGCNGGQPSAALQWMSNVGVVTGGDYPDIGKGTSCRPYTLAPCAHHVPATSKYPKCPSNEYPTPQCTKQCSESKYPTDYSADKTKGSHAYSVSSVQQMMQELVNYGPLAVAFSVYSDFLTYKSGVYTHQTGQMLGGHAVEMVGYGTENGKDYWLVKNSWNEEWGDNGYFKIARGTDECGIEDDVTGIQFK